MMIMETSTLIAFSLTALALVLTPGPDTLLILHRSIHGGVALGLATVAGVQFGLIFHTLLAVFGLTVLIASSPALFTAVALAGSIYLFWLGVHAIRRTGNEQDDREKMASSSNKLSAFRDAMLCNILNPKVIILYLALIPNFISLELGSVETQLLTLGILMVVINSVWQIPLSLMAFAASKTLKNPKVQTAIDWGSGMVLIVFSVIMFYENVL